MPIGIGKTTAGRSGNVPQVNITGYTRQVQKRLFYSRREQALILEKTVRGGFEDLEMGQVMTQVYKDGTLVRDFIVPYGANGDVAVTASDNSANTVTIAAADAVKFAVSDVVTVNDDETTAENRTITGITVSGTSAVIALDALTNTFTHASAIVKHRQDGNYYILDQDIDTGAENKAEGALGSVVYSNAVLYKDAVIGMDSTVLADLNGKEDGVFYIIR